MSGNPLLNALSAIRTPPVMGISVGYDTLANALSGVPANLAGAPVDMAYMMTMRPEEMAGIAMGMPNQRPELREFPGSSDWIGEKMGADVDSLPFLLSAMISPDGSDVALPAAKLAASGKLDDLIQAMTVFHGSPHKWDKVDLSKVGTGEGAQAYGHGFYVAENPGVAKDYQSKLSYWGKPKALTDDEFSDFPPDIQSLIHAKANNGGISWDLIDQQVSGLVGRQKIDPRTGAGTGEPLLGPAQFERLTASIKKLKRDGLELDSGGHLYELDLPDSIIDKMLDWDKPLSEDAARAINVNTNGVNIGQKALEDGLTGEEVYKWLDVTFGGQDKASEYLNSLGIPGIKYLDGTSRSAGEGTRNFVVFDESYITPLKRNGEEIAQALPMDEASRMARAREMGFDTDTVWYHGTPDAVFDEFAAGSFFTTDPSYANKFTSPESASSSFYGAKGDAPALIPVRLAGDVFDTRIPEHRAIYENSELAKYAPLTENGLPDWAVNSDVMDLLEGSGFSSFIVDEGSDLSGARPPSRVVIDPSKVRSINATFDPAKADSANLNALLTDALMAQAAGMA